MKPTPQAELDVAEQMLVAAMHFPENAERVRAALVVRAVVRRTSPWNARITGKGGSLVFPEPLPWSRGRSRV